jgi:hypothetical protein
VPSAAAVRALGGGQPELESAFRSLLADADGAYDEGRQERGLLVRAGFGEGKSHLLATFERIALDAGFAVSRAIISKETPLHDPVKLLAGAVEGLRVPDAIGRGLEEVGLRLRRRLDSAEYAALVRRLNEPGGLNSRFAATLFIYEHGTQDPELGDRVLRFWSGDKLPIGELRAALRGLGHAASYPLEPVKVRELALQTLIFVPMLVRAAGLRGWVLLIDELELIGRYSRLQRARSYAELAALMGALDVQRPGLVAAGAITDDFESAVLLDPRKADLDQMLPFMATRDPAVATGAEQGMRIIRDARLLRAPDEGVLRTTYDTLRKLHSQAYAWDPPEVAWPETLGSTAMRTYVRAWINAWDVHRLYPDFEEGDSPYALEEVLTDYGEDPQLELGADGTGADGASAAPPDDPDAW